MSVLPFKRPSYEAKIHRIVASGFRITIAGTLCGGIDFAVQCVDESSRTYNFSPDEARLIATALNAVATDVQTNCLFHDDPLLAEDRP